MYKWVGEVNKLVQGLSKEMNDIDTRKNVKDKVVEILEKNKVQAFVDCSSRVNSPEVVSNGSFRLVVETTEVNYTFKYVKKEK